MKIEVGQIWTTTSDGDIKILEYVNCKQILIKFLNTGYTTYTLSSCIRTGAIRDKFKPRTYGVGFIGDGVYNSVNAKVAYSKWNGMLERCYSDRYQKDKPSYKGCTVSEEWHNFQKFAEWHFENYFEGGELDKDLLSGKTRGKLYSPQTCTYICRQLNVEVSQAKHWKFISPENVVTDIYNLEKFCRDNGLSQAHMVGVNSGYRKSHRGWTKYLPTGTITGENFYE